MESRWQKAALRMIAVLGVSFTLVYISNRLVVMGFPSYSVSYPAEGLLCLVAVLGAWKAGFLGKVQSKSWAALTEITVLAVFFAGLLFVVGIDCGPSLLCLGSLSGGTVEFPTINQYLQLLTLYAAVAFAEELVFRGYVVGEIDPSSKFSRTSWAKPVAVVVSSALFTVWHIPKLTTGTFDYVSVGNALVGILAGGLTYGIVYVMTGRNLAVTVIMHFFYDAYGNVLALNPLDPFLSVRLQFLVLGLPAILTIGVALASARVAKFRGKSARLLN